MCKAKSITHEQAKSMNMDRLKEELGKTLSLINQTQGRETIKLQNIYNRSYNILINEFTKRIFGIPHWQRLDLRYFNDISKYSKSIITKYHPELERVFKNNGPLKQGKERQAPENLS